MSNHDDSVFVRNFSLVLVGLCVVGIVAFILAKVVSRSAEDDQVPSDGVAARVAPMGQVNTGPESLTIAATTPAPAAAAKAADTGATAQGAATGADSGKAVYDKACFACHAQGIAGAPKHGDMAAWEARLDQGVATLYDHAINGYTGDAGMMPARGGNPSLSDAEVKAAVDYMTAAVGGGNGDAKTADEGQSAPAAEAESETADLDVNAAASEGESAPTAEAESAAADPAPAQDEAAAAEQDAQTDAAAAAETTADTGRGKEVYDSACFVCHTPGAAGAPKLSDTAAWKARLEKGIEALYHSSINGFMGDAGMMPPKGGRPDFSDDDVKAAVDYMVSGAR